MFQMTPDKIFKVLQDVTFHVRTCVIMKTAGAWDLFVLVKPFPRLSPKLVARDQVI